MTQAESYHASVTEDQKFTAGFTQTPNAVVRDPNLSMQAKYIYTLLRSYAWQDPDAYPGLERLRSDAGAKEETLRRYISELEESGFIQVERRGLNRTNRYVFSPLELAAESGTPSNGGIQNTPDGGYPDHPHRGGSRTPPTGGSTKTQDYKDPWNEDSGNEDPVDDDDNGRVRAPEEEEKNGSEVNNGHKHLAPTSLTRVLAAVGAEKDSEYPNLSAEEADRWVEALGLEESAHASLARAAFRIRETHGPDGVSAADETVQRCGAEHRAGAVSNLDAYLARAVAAALSRVSPAGENSGPRTKTQLPLSESETMKSVIPPAAESETIVAETSANRSDKRQADKEFYSALESDEPEIASCLPVLREIENWPSGPNEDRRTAEALRKYTSTFPDVDPKELCTLFADWSLDNPLKANSNPRSRLRTWFQKDREYGGRASRNRPAPGQVPLNGRRKSEKPVYGVGNQNRKTFKEIMEERQL